MPDGPRCEDDFCAWTQYHAEAEPRFDWTGLIINARAALDDKLTPTLRRDLGESLMRPCAVARKQATIDLLKYGERDAADSLPPECPYTIDQILAEDWYPEPAASLSDASSDRGSTPSAVR